MPRRAVQTRDNHLSSSARLEQGLDDIVRAYFEAHPAHHEMAERWPIQGEMRVRLSLGSVWPPAQICSSVLAIVLGSRRSVLYLWPGSPTPSIGHLLIGGRPKGNETPEQTVVREVAEETGWRVSPVRMIGFRHFHQLEPRSERSDRPYPDFVQPILAARAIAFDPGLVIPEDRIPAELLDLADVERLLEPAQRPLLHAATEACSVAG